jgi:enoyl-CoA hydratase
MAYENIIFETEGNVGIIKFNRPKALNAINPDVLSETQDALNRIEADPAIKVLVLTGEGDKAFVAGADIAHMVKLDPLQSKRFSRDGHELGFRLESLPIPVIACVNGFALGGGAEIAMASDFIYASEMCMTGVMISAQEAKEIGLVNKVFPPDKLWEETMKTAQLIAAKGKVSLKGVKECIDRGLDVDLRDGCYMEMDAFALCATSPDKEEGMAAFLEKRKPEFKGDLY